MKKILLLLAMLIIAAGLFISLYPRDNKQYAVSRIPTVLYNTENVFKAYEIVNNKLTAPDRSGLVREIEAQALPGTVFEIHDTINVNGVNVYKVTTDEYWNIPADFYFYIDSRSVQLVNEKPEPRKLSLPSKNILLKRLRSIQKQTEQDLIPYIWGGNTLEGIKENARFYSNGEDLSKLNSTDKKQFFLKGLDCTGLIYYITNGYTPRNSSWLRTFGKAVNIENKNIDEVIATVEPLDIVVHQGHVFMILDKKTTIESRLSKGGGVVMTPIKERFEEVFAKKVPLNMAPQYRAENSWFVIRRMIF